MLIQQRMIVKLINQTEINGEWKLLSDDEKKGYCCKKHQARTLKEESRNPTKNKIKNENDEKVSKNQTNEQKTRIVVVDEKKKNEIISKDVVIKSVPATTTTTTKDIEFDEEEKFDVKGDGFKIYEKRWN